AGFLRRLRAHRQRPRRALSHLSRAGRAGMRDAMAPFGLFHPDPAHRRRQLRWVIPGLLALLLAGLAALAALRLTHRIVRPVHALHRALDALAAGDLGVRLALDRRDEFGEVGAALNRLAETLSTTLATVRALVDRIAAEGAAGDPAAGAAVRRLVGELDRTMEFFRLEPRRTIGEDGD